MEKKFNFGEFLSHEWRWISFLSLDQRRPKRSFLCLTKKDLHQLHYGMWLIVYLKCFHFIFPCLFLCVRFSSANNWQMSKKNVFRKGNDHELKCVMNWFTRAFGNRIWVAPFHRGDHFNSIDDDNSITDKFSSRIQWFNNRWILLLTIEIVGKTTRKSCQTKKQQRFVLFCMKSMLISTKPQMKR